MTIERNAKKYASENAYTRWQKYKTKYFNDVEIDDNKRILPVVYDSKRNPTNLVLYECDLFKDKYAHGDTKYTKDVKKDLFTYEGERLSSGYKNDFVVDDCSKSNTNIVNILLNTCQFEIKSVKEKRMQEIKIEPGDLIYRKEKAHIDKINDKQIKVTDILGHVEFCIGNDKYVGWGKIQKMYTINKTLIKQDEGFYSNYDGDYNQPYITILKFKGDERR